MTDKSKIDSGWDELLAEGDAATATPKPTPARPSKTREPSTVGPLPPPPSVGRPPGASSLPSVKIPKVPRLGSGSGSTSGRPSAAPTVPVAAPVLGEASDDDSGAIADALPPPPEFVAPESSVEVPLEVASALEDGAPLDPAPTSMSDALAAAVAQDLGGRASPGAQPEQTDSPAESDVFPVSVGAVAIEANATPAARAQARSDDTDDEPDDSSAVSQVEVIPEHLARPAVEIDRRATGPVATVDAAEADGESASDERRASKSVVAASPAPVAPPSRWPWFAGAAAVVVVGVGLWTLWTMRGSDPPVPASDPPAAAAKASPAGPTPPTPAQGGEPEGEPAQPEPVVAAAGSGSSSGGTSGDASTDGSGSGGSGDSAGSDTAAAASTGEADEGDGGGSGTGEDPTAAASDEGTTDPPPDEPPAPPSDPERDTREYDAAYARHEQSGAAEDLLAMTQAACDLDEGPWARDAYRKLKGKALRGQAMSHCQHAGVDLLAKVDGYTAPELRRRAEEALARGDTSEAIRLGRASNKVERNSAAMEIATQAACRSGDAETAAALLRHVSKKARPPLVEQCGKAGVTL